ncbi:UvrD-helicase domain-containing protein [Hymenobacter sp. 15J16-1T3B]|uniref:UvrD-helicase domain-containing protein n=1 Tax=Hymenobacter sp. 15J16-1T3B TaxID=2886941 RepID=UPI001D0FB8A2|nr:UvrD-helicase domain-containing protein [Hymenobacter sp. 15J16-1T3B]MCC3160273.1 UvrD-helicase domain-containing protein [Hymenobacter sp. 15J16-1T3B]
MPSTFRIYSASAGSGKTYQLTKEYLRLALGADEPGYYKSILAITFTNAAAAEMKERIIGALRGFVHPGSDAKADALLRELAAEMAEDGLLPPEAPELQERELRRRAEQTFRLVLYHYADFAVSTIDSFVQRVVQAFTRELGLPAAFEVELDDESVLHAAVALLLDKVNRGQEHELLTRTLQDYALSKAEEGRSWNMLPEEIMRFGKFLLNESVHEAVAQLQQMELKQFRKLHKTLKERREQMRSDIQAVGDRAVALLERHGLQPDQLAGGSRGVHSHFTKPLRWLEDPAGTPTSTARKAAESGKWGSGDAMKGPLKPALEAVAPELTEAFNELELLRDRYLSQYLLIDALLPQLFHVSLLSELSKAVQQVSMERNVVLIGEFNRRLAGIVLREPVPFLYERLGERYQHLLIDEFQDTSELQWNNLLPLVENAVAGGNLSLAVGDAKQAIYRWRGGEMEQILRLYQGTPRPLVERAQDLEMRAILAQRYIGLAGALEPMSLQTNYRSGPQIIQFNNDFFAHVAQGHPHSELVGSIYDEHFGQQAPATALAGPPSHVEILLTQHDAPARLYRPAEGRYSELPLPGHHDTDVLDYDESTLYLTLALVEQALADGFRLEDVAVLCRRRDQSRRVAKFLKERGYDIISADSLSLEFAEVVNLLVAILRVLHQPADSLARVEALLLVDKVVRGVPPTPTRARRIGEIAKEERSRPFFDELRRLGFDVQETQTGNQDLYELCETLMGLFGLLHRREESEYLFRFLDLTLEYSLRFGNNLGNFLAYWDQRKANLSINAPAGRGGAVTITTVHKAKGLAYGVVIVPWADWSLEPTAAFGGAYLWGRLDEDEKPVADMPPVAVVKQRKELTQTALAGQYAEEREKTFVEALNLLYVAFTRPRQRLYILTRRPDAAKAAKDDPSAPAQNVAQLLYRYLVDLGQWNEEQLTYVLSQGAPAPLSTQHQAPGTDNIFSLTNLETAAWEQRLRLRRHASTVFDFSEQQQQREWNRKLHFALRRVITAQDVTRVAGQLTAEGLVSRREQPELLQRLRQVVDNARLAPYFRPDVIAETEREILVGGAPREDYKPDRVVFEPQQGPAPGRVTLIDFRVPPPEDRHQTMLRQYGQLFKRLGYTDVRGLVYYFETEEVVEFEC